MPAGVRMRFNFSARTFVFQFAQKRRHFRAAAENAEIFEIFVD
jgi:hypothetical protein